MIHSVIRACSLFVLFPQPLLHHQQRSSYYTSSTYCIMHPRLRVQAGTSLSSMSDVPVNSTSSVQVNSDAFEGGVGVYLVDYLGPEGSEGVAQPPQGAMPSGCTMNLRIEGRFQGEGGQGDDIVRVFQTCSIFPCRSLSEIYESEAGLSEL